MLFWYDTSYINCARGYNFTAVTSSLDRVQLRGFSSPLARVHSLMSIHTKKNNNQIFLISASAEFQNLKRVGLNFGVCQTFFFPLYYSIYVCWMLPLKEHEKPEMDDRNLNLPPHLWPLEGGKCFSTGAPVKTCLEFEMSKQNKKKTERKKTTGLESILGFLILGLWLNITSSSSPSVNYVAY